MFTPTTVQGAMKPFQKILKNLEAVAQTSEFQAAGQREIAVTAGQRAADLTDEATKAHNARSKLSELLAG